MIDCWNGLGAPGVFLSKELLMFLREGVILLILAEVRVTHKQMSVVSVRHFLKVGLKI